jgi:class 3 adenylate cyclase
MVLHILFGSQNRNSLNIYGPTVNFASRLEGFAKNDEIIVSSTVRNMVGERFKFLKIPVRNRTKDGFKGFDNEKFVYSVTQKT